MTFNLIELATRWLLTSLLDKFQPNEIPLLDSLLDDFWPSWTFYFMIFHLAEYLPDDF